MMPWPRPVVLLAALAALALPGSSASRLALDPLLHERAAANEIDAPFQMDGSVGYGGLPPCCGSQRYPGLMLRFIERGRFGVGLVFRNGSERPLTVVNVRVLEPPRSLVHQIGTRLLPWDPNPPSCGGRGCRQERFLRPPYDAVSAVPVTIAPEQDLGAQLNFELGSCRELRRASATPTERIEVEYRYDDGPLLRQTLPLGSAQLRMRTTSASDCAARPYSQLVLAGAFEASSDRSTPANNTTTCRRLPDGSLQCSGADRCTRTRGGGILFRGGLYLARDDSVVRVWIELRRFGGLGLYGTVHAPARALGPAKVSVGTWITNRPRFESETSFVSVTRAAGTTLGGRVRARGLGPRDVPFRVSGVWRCTTSGW